MGFTYPPGTSTDPEEETEFPIPKSFLLSQNHPNPFNPSTTIDYTIPGGKAVLVHLDVYDLRGHLIRTLVNEYKGPDRYTVSWNGRDSQGEVVASGIYLYCLEAGGFASVRKMTILK